MSESRAIVETGDAVEWLNDQPADSVDLIFGSPPYCDARTYGIGAQRDCVAWVDWMLDVTTAAQRVSRGPVFWVAAGVTRKRNYWPACEGLMWEWWKRGGEHQLYRPCVFHRVGVPGSGGKDYLRADWEFVICFKRPGELPWSDNTAMGHPPRWAPGGAMSHRLSSGAKVNQWGHSANSGGTQMVNGKVRSGKTRPSYRTKTPSQTQRANGADGNGSYDPPTLANPGNVIKCKVGGGLMGSALAHENEAPFPESLAEFFIRSFCPPDGISCDVFSGSGTTASVALRCNRRFRGCDVRQSQVDLTKRRISEVQRSLLT